MPSGTEALTREPIWKFMKLDSPDQAEGCGIGRCLLFAPPHARGRWEAHKPPWYVTTSRSRVPRGGGRPTGRHGM